MFSRHDSSILSLATSKDEETTSRTILQSVSWVFNNTLGDSKVFHFLLELLSFLPVSLSNCLLNAELQWKQCKRCKIVLRGDFQRWKEVSKTADSVKFHQRTFLKCEKKLSQDLDPQNDLRTRGNETDFGV